MKGKNKGAVGLSVAVCMAAFFSLYAHADGCEYDTQCKGDRICENKICVSPQPAGNSAAAVAPAAKSESSKPKEHGAGFLGLFSKAQSPANNTSYFCCTTTQKLGPFPNPDSDGTTYQVGDACSGTSISARHYAGRVCK